MMISVAMLDLDGTIYKGKQLINGSDKAVLNLIDNNVEVYFCTNNSLIMPKQISKKLNKMGIACDPEHIVSSGQVAIDYVNSNNLKNVFVSGSEDLIQAFKDSSIEICNEKSCSTLIIGMDSNYDYEKMTRSVRAAINSKTIILCNEDRIFVKEDGIYPGCGGMTSSILYCSNKKPDKIIGKPQTVMPEYIQKVTNAKKEEMIVIGDTYESDIKMAHNFGCKSLLISNYKGEKTIKSLKDTINWDWSNY